METEKTIIILQDSREQSPITFDHCYITETRVQKLLVGDYACLYQDNSTCPFYFERKGSMSDLFNTMGKEYPRFKKELMRAKENNIKLILIIEGSLTKVLAGCERSYLDGFSVLRKLFTLWIRYGLLPVFCRNEEEMSRYITEFYLAYGREFIDKKK